MEKRDLRDLTLEELVREMEKLGEKSFRAKQIFRWLYGKGEKDISAMRNLSREGIKALSEVFFVGEPEVAASARSKDGSEKLVLRLHDGELIETVIIPKDNRKTICLSTQSGCKYACAFCASGKRKFRRNLSLSEIIGQVMIAGFGSGHELTNYVFMGMGEPLDNFDNLKKAITVMTDPEGLGISARRITVSTCGLVPGLKALKGLAAPVNLSVSLHSVRNELRSELMPVNRVYPLEKLMPEIKKVSLNSSRRVTFEYILIKGKNDSANDAERLAMMASGVNARVNIIPLSPVKGYDFTAPKSAEVRKFAEIIKRKRVRATIRESKGGDIQAACGQLAGAVEKNEI